MNCPNCNSTNLKGDPTRDQNMYCGDCGYFPISFYNMGSQKNSPPPPPKVSVTDEEIGNLSLCKMCKDSIRFVGPYWEHIGLPPGVQPRHPALPMTDEEIGEHIVQLGVDNPLPEDKEINLIEKILVHLKQSAKERGDEAVFNKIGNPKDVARQIVERNKHVR